MIKYETDRWLNLQNHILQSSRRYKRTRRPGRFDMERSNRNLNEHRATEVNNFSQIVKNYFDEKDIEVILDIGSRYGGDSIALKQTFPNSKVYAFECNPQAIKVWKGKVKNKNIYLVEKAVSDTDGPVDFYPINPDKTVTPHEDGNIGASSLLRANPKYPYEKYVQDCTKVEGTTIDRWARLEGIKQVDLIWIDLQGSELRAFRGMADTLKTLKMIHTEVAFRPVYINQPLFKDINTFLKQQNFLFLIFENISGWFGDANYINALYLSNLQKWICKGKAFLWWLTDLKYHKKRLKLFLKT